MLELNKVYCGDCLELMKQIPKRISEIIKQQCYIPTLSELIEKCGEDFLELYQWVDEKQWEATSKSDKDGFHKTGLESTPEEAIAKLWLKLNKTSPKPSAIRGEDKV